MANEEIREWLKSNPDYRKDEKDGRFFPYERYPSYELNRGLLFQSKNKEYRIFLNAFSPSKKYNERQEGNITMLEPVNPDESNIRRDEFIWIHHSTGRNEGHTLRVVVDQKSDNKGNGTVLSPHFNFKQESTDSILDGTCEKCEKYFNFIDHMEIEFEIRDSDHKRINWEGTVAKFVRELKEKRFSEDYDLLETDFTKNFINPS